MMKKIATLLFGVLCFISLRGQGYEYPSIPDNLTDSKQRASYMALHFWDNANMDAPDLFLKPKIVQDYLYILGIIDREGVSVSLDHTILSLSAHPTQLKMLLFWLGRLLKNPLGDFYNETLYLEFVEKILLCNSLPDYKETLEDIKLWLQKNPIGDVATDFSFISKNVDTLQLSTIKAPLILLAFVSPECSQCHRVEIDFLKDSLIQGMVDSEQLTIVAICTVDDHEAWLSHQYPSSWLCGYDYEGTILSQKLYELRQYPSLYLLDANKKVLSKEMTNLKNVHDIIIQGHVLEKPK